MFKHVTANGNICDAKTLTALDNPFANGAPNAFLFVSPIFGVGYHVEVEYYGSSPPAGCPANRWFLWQDGADWAPGEAVNVLVINGDIFGSKPPPGKTHRVR